MTRGPVGGQLLDHRPRLDAAGFLVGVDQKIRARAAVSALVIMPHQGEYADDQPSCHRSCRAAQDVSLDPPAASWLPTMPAGQTVSPVAEQELARPGIGRRVAGEQIAAGRVPGVWRNGNQPARTVREDANRPGLRLGASEGDSAA